MAAKKIVIVGGGTAGWMAANLMAGHWREEFAISLIESPQIGIIGVGEGSTPPLKDFMEGIGARESEWMAACNATYKVGIGFSGWSSRPGFSSYFHPFLAEPDQVTAPAFLHNSLLRRNGIDLAAHPDQFFLAAFLARNRLGPIAADNFPFKVSYGYHFDAALLGKYLAGKAAGKGVVHLQDTVTEVLRNGEGDIAGLRTGRGELIEAELYVDCTGFKSQLLQQALQVPFHSFGENLFNDAAVVLPTPQGGEIAPQTLSTAMQCGWAWSIPLTNRIGNGYVYSSAFCSADQAESELRETLGLLDDPQEARHLKMKVGRVERHWAGNCLAVGLSQGFIEPLEATALDLVKQTVEKFIETYTRGGFTAMHRDEFNAHVNGRFDAVRDYIVCHYKVNSRRDSEYWIENARNEALSDPLAAILEAWSSGRYIAEVLERHRRDVYFPNVSWNCLLAGYGLYPEPGRLKPGRPVAHKYDLDKIQEFIRRCALNFRPHRQQLDLLRAA